MWGGEGGDQGTTPPDSADVKEYIWAESRYRLVLILLGGVQHLERRGDENALCSLQSPPPLPVSKSSCCCIPPRPLFVTPTQNLFPRNLSCPPLLFFLHPQSSSQCGRLIPSCFLENSLTADSTQGILRIRRHSTRPPPHHLLHPHS